MTLQEERTKSQRLLCTKSRFCQSAQRGRPGIRGFEFGAGRTGAAMVREHGRHLALLGAHREELALEQPLRSRARSRGHQQELPQPP
jgi:hypothetical protein